MSRYQPIRVGLCYHVIEGRLSDGAAWTYVWLILRSNRGSIWTNAAKIAAERGQSRRTIQGHLRELKKGGYIRSFRDHGSRGAYPILIHKYEDWSGTEAVRLNAFASNSYDDPVWESLNRGGNSGGNRRGNSAGNSAGNTVLTPTTPTTPTKEDPGVELPDALAPLSGLLDRLRSACGSTRKTGQMADTVWRGVLSKLEQYPPPVVREGVTRYLDRGDHVDGKDERYMLGIVRGVAQEAARHPKGDPDGITTSDWQPPKPSLPVFERTDDVADSVWADARAALEADLDPRTFEDWIAPLEAADVAIDALVLVAPSVALTGPPVKVREQIAEAIGGPYRIEVGRVERREAREARTA